MLVEPALSSALTSTSQNTLEPHRRAWHPDLTILATIVVGLIVLLFTIINVSTSICTDLKQEVSSLSQLIEVDRLNTLQAAAADLTNPEYRFYQSQLHNIAEADPEIEFLYAMKQVEGQVVFLFDSTLETDEDHSPPGQMYYEASETLLKSISEGTVEIELAGDRWGYWLSAFAPIIDPQTGETIALLGMDVDAFSSFFIPITLYALVPVSVFGLFLVLLMSKRRLARLQTQALSEQAAILHVTSHEVRAPLTAVRWNCEAYFDEHTSTKLPLDQKMVSIYLSVVQVVERITILNEVVKINHMTVMAVSEPASLQKSITKAVKQFAKMAELKNVQLKVSAQNDFQVRIESEMLTTVMKALILNLLYYGDEKTTIEIKVQQLGTSVEVTFAGQGKAIKPEELEKVFVGIHHTDESFSAHTEATGLGLFLVKQVAALVDGIAKVAVQDDVTIFTLTLPIAHT